MSETSVTGMRHSQLHVSQGLGVYTLGRAVLAPHLYLCSKCLELPLGLAHIASLDAQDVLDECSCRCLHINRQAECMGQEKR